jgi:hypothetical protein
MNAVGPVAVIAAGIFMGYLVLSKRVDGIIASWQGTSATSNTVPASGSVGANTATATYSSPVSLLAASNANLQSVMTTGVAA